MLLMIDNYDSFTYNLVQYFGELGEEVKVFRNDAISLGEIARLNPKYLVISPGPCAPAQAGVSLAAIREFAADLVARMCARLIDGGAPALHFYTLNLAKPTLNVLAKMA